MSYYGDAYYAGDPGLFSFVKKIRLGRVLGGLVKAVPGANGVLAAVNAVRQAAGAGVSPRPATFAAPPIVQVPQSPLPSSGIATIGVGRKARTKRRTSRRRSLSPLASSRRARLRRMGYRV